MLEESKPSWVKQNEVKHACGQAPCKTYLDCEMSKNVSVLVTNAAVSTVYEDIKWVIIQKLQRVA